MLANRNSEVVHAFDDAFSIDSEEDETPTVEVPSSRPQFTLSPMIGRASRPLGAISSDVDIPTSFLCPILHEVMRQPVVAMDGFSYERSAISKWLEQNDSCNSPMTGQPMMDDRVIPNHVLHSMIVEFYESHKDDSLQYYEQLLENVAQSIVEQ